MKESMSKQWYEFVEIPRSTKNPVKLDRILAERMREFMSRRKVKPYSGTRERLLR